MANKLAFKKLFFVFNTLMASASLFLISANGLLLKGLGILDDVFKNKNEIVVTL